MTRYGILSSADGPRHAKDIRDRFNRDVAPYRPDSADDHAYALLVAQAQLDQRIAAFGELLDLVGDMAIAHHRLEQALPDELDAHLRQGLEVIAERIEGDRKTIGKIASTPKQAIDQVVHMLRNAAAFEDCRPYREPRMPESYRLPRLDR